MPIIFHSSRVMIISRMVYIHNSAENFDILESIPFDISKSLHKEMNKSFYRYMQLALILALLLGNLLGLKMCSGKKIPIFPKHSRFYKVTHFFISSINIPTFLNITKILFGKKDKTKYGFHNLTVSIL